MENKVQDTKPEVLPAEQVKHSEEIRKIGMEIVHAIGEVAGKYMSLCKYIRANKVAPKLATFELLKIGFKKTRVSEIIRVAKSSDKTFNEYEAKLIGFDRALSIARIEIKGQPAQLTDAGKTLMEEGTLSSKDETAAKKDAAETTRGTSKSKTPGMKMDAGAQLILNACGAHTIKALKKHGPKVWTLGQFTVTLTFKSVFEDGAETPEQE